MTEISRKAVYSAGDVAAILDVSVGTAKSLIDSGAIRGTRGTEGRQRNARQVAHNDLVRYLESDRGHEPFLRRLMASPEASPTPDPATPGV